MGNLVDWVDDNITHPINAVWNNLETSSYNQFTLLVDPLGMAASVDWAAGKLGLSTPLADAMDKSGFDNWVDKAAENNIPTYVGLAAASYGIGALVGGASAAAAEGGTAAAGGAGSASEAAAWDLFSGGTAAGAGEASGSVGNSILSAVSKLGSSALDYFKSAGDALSSLMSTESTGGELGAWDAFSAEPANGGIWGAIKAGISKGYTGVKDMANFLGVSEAALKKTGIMAALGVVGQAVIGEVPQLKPAATAAPGTKDATFDQYLWLQNNPGKTPTDYAQGMYDWKVWQALNPDKNPVQAVAAHEAPETLSKYNWNNLTYTTQNPGQAAPQTYPTLPAHVTPVLPAQQAFTLPAIDYSGVQKVAQQTTQLPAHVSVPTVADASTIAGLWSNLLGQSPGKVAESYKTGS